MNQTSRLPPDASRVETAQRRRVTSGWVRPRLCGNLRRIARGRATLTSPGAFDNRCVRFGSDEPLDGSDAL
jgi:hypothetical protein